MNAHCYFEISHVFIASPEALKKLAKLLAGRIGKLEIQADCADGTIRSFGTMKELLAYENPSAKAIRRIRFRVWSSSSSHSYVDLSGRGISLDYSGRDDMVSRLRTDTLDIIEGMRPCWYGSIYSIDFFNLGCGLGFCGFALLALGVFPDSVNTAITSYSNAVGEPVMYGGIALLYASGLIVNRIRDRIFPRAVFTIGQGEKRFQKLKSAWKWGFSIVLFPLIGKLGWAAWQTITG